MGVMGWVVGPGEQPEVGDTFHWAQRAVLCLQSVTETDSIHRKS